MKTLRTLLAVAWLSVVIGLLILSSTGLLVAIAIGDEVLISAFRGRRKVNEIQLEEALTLSERVDEIKRTLEKIENWLGAIKKEEESLRNEEQKLTEQRAILAPEVFETKKIEFIADKSGEFSILCSVYCGKGHHEMKAKLIVE